MAVTTIGRTRIEASARAGPGLWGQALRRLTRRLAMAGAVVIVAFLLLGLPAPLVAPHDPAPPGPSRTPSRSRASTT